MLLQTAFHRQPVTLAAARVPPDKLLPRPPQLARRPSATRPRAPPAASTRRRRPWRSSSACSPPSGPRPPAAGGRRRKGGGGGRRWGGGVRRWAGVLAARADGGREAGATCGAGRRAGADGGRLERARVAGHAKRGAAVGAQLLLAQAEFLLSLAPAAQPDAEGVDAAARAELPEGTGQPVVYDAGSTADFTSINLPSGKAGGLVRLDATPALANPLHSDGPWGWLRMMDKAALSPQGDVLRLTFEGEGHRVEYPRRASSVINPCRRDALEQFRCPTTL